MSSKNPPESKESSIASGGKSHAVGGNDTADIVRFSRGEIEVVGTKSVTVWNREDDQRKN